MKDIIINNQVVLKRVTTPDWESTCGSKYLTAAFSLETAEYSIITEAFKKIELSVREDLVVFSKGRLRYIEEYHRLPFMVIRDIHGNDPRYYPLLKGDVIAILRS